MVYRCDTCQSAHFRQTLSIFSSERDFLLKGLSVAAWSSTALFPREKSDMRAVKRSVQKWQPHCTSGVCVGAQVSEWEYMFQCVYYICISTEDTFLCQIFSPEIQFCLHQRLPEAASYTKELHRGLTNAFIWEGFSHFDIFFKSLRKKKHNLRKISPTGLDRLVKTHWLRCLRLFIVLFLYFR